jgi:hypothetical protein
MITGGPCLLWLKNLERSTSKQASPWPRTLPSSEAFTNAPSVDLRNFAPKLICIIGASRVSLVLTLDCQSLTAAQCNGWVFHWSAVGAKRWSTRFGSHPCCHTPACHVPAIRNGSCRDGTSGVYGGGMRLVCSLQRGYRPLHEVQLTPPVLQGFSAGAALHE